MRSGAAQQIVGSDSRENYPPIDRLAKTQKSVVQLRKFKIKQ
jgi:hypothetical protein